MRAELAEMDTLASQSEAAIYRLLTSVLASGSLRRATSAAGLPSDAELEAAMRPADNSTASAVFLRKQTAGNSNPQAKHRSAQRSLHGPHDSASRDAALA